MDIKAIARRGAAIGFSIAGGIQKTATLHTGKTTAQNFENDTANQSGGQDVNLTGFFVRLDQRDTPAGAQSAARFIVQADGAPTGIDVADNMTIDGKKWEIDAVDPVADSVIIFYIHR